MNLWLTRTYLAIALSLSLALTGLYAAQMRAAPDATGQIVLCTGTGPVTVYVDDEGQPTRPPHHCPDCVIHLLVALEGPEQQRLAPQAPDRAPAPAAANAPMAQTTARATARGPPANV